MPELLGCNSLPCKDAEQKAYPRIGAIPFESEHKFMATLHKGPNGKEVLFVKGAPEIIMANCDRQQLADGTTAPLARDHFQKVSDKLAGQGERVLGPAWLESPGLKAGSLGPADLPRNPVLIGLLDPPRQEAIEAVKECHGGGIIDSSLSIKGHLDNKFVALGIGAVIILQLLFTYAPPLQRPFGNEAVPFYVWPWPIAGGFVFFLVVELEKLIIRSSASLKSAVTAVEAGT